MKILLVQTRISYLNLKANIGRMERILRGNSFLRPDLVVFPEDYLLGPLYGHYDLALKKNDPVFAKLKSLAMKYRVNLVPGSFILREGKKLFNATCFISAKGEILGYHRKICRWASERKFLNKGNKATVIETPIGRVALQICADIFSAQFSQQYRALKPDIIINTSLWSEEDSSNTRIKVPPHLERTQTTVLARARALENRAYFIYCNYAKEITLKAKTGRKYHYTSIGNSMVVDPFGEVIARASGNGDEIVTAEIKVKRCHYAKYGY